MIVLIRHAEAENAQGRAIGQTDLPLSETGKKQASRLSKSLLDVRFNKIFSSPLSRTMCTAETIATNAAMPIIESPELAEINLGDWDGLSFARIKTDFPDAYHRRGQDIAGFRPPGGESFLDLKERVKPFIDSLEEQELPTLLVTHAGVIRIIMHLALDFPLEHIFRIKPAHCHTTIILRKDSSLILQGFNLPPGPDLADFLKFQMQHRI